MKKWRCLFAIAVVIAGMLLAIWVENSRLGVTRANFHRIHTGMPLAEVEAILGAPIAEQEAPLGWPHRTMIWADSGVIRIDITFDEQKCVSEKRLEDSSFFGRLRQQQLRWLPN